MYLGRRLPQAHRWNRPQVSSEWHTGHGNHRISGGIGAPKFDTHPSWALSIFQQADLSEGFMSRPRYRCDAPHAEADGRRVFNAGGCLPSNVFLKAFHLSSSSVGSNKKKSQTALIHLSSLNLF